MSEFVTDLDVRKLLHDGSEDKRGTWKLLAPLVFKSKILGKTITVPDGFVTDFASVPRLPVAYLLTGDYGHEAAVVHDWLYSAQAVDGEHVTRKQADAVFREALTNGGEPDWRTWLMWMGVRIGGGGPYESAGQPQPERVAAKITASNLEAP